MGKDKRGERESTEEEVNPAKKANMDAAIMLSGFQTTLKDIPCENRKMRDEMAKLKSSFGTQEEQLNSLKATLNKVMKANEPMKTELQVLRSKVKDQKSEIDDLYKSQVNAEQYTRKNALELHGVGPKTCILLQKRWSLRDRSLFITWGGSEGFLGGSLDF